MSDGCGGFLWLVIYVWRKINFLKNYKTHRNREDQLSVSCQVSNVTVQGDTFLCCASFAYGQRYSQNRVGTKLSWRRNRGSHKHNAHMQSVLTGAETCQYTYIPSPHTRCERGLHLLSVPSISIITLSSFSCSSTLIPWKKNTIFLIQ